MSTLVDVTWQGAHDSKSQPEHIKAVDPEFENCKELKAQTKQKVSCRHKGSVHIVHIIFERKPQCGTVCGCTL